MNSATLAVMVPDEPPSANHRLFSERGFYVLLALVILMALAAPRLCAYAPPAAGLIAALLLWAEGKRPAPRLTPSVSLILWIPAFLLLAAASALWALDPEEAHERTIKIALVLLPGLLLLTVAGGRGRGNGLWLVPAASLLAGMLLAAEMWGGLPVYHLLNSIPFSTRVRLDFINRHIVAAILILPAALAMAWHGAVMRRVPPRAMAAALAVVTILVALRTTSQSAQLALLVMAIFYFAFPYRLKAAWGLLAALLAGGIMAAPWLAQAMFAHLPPLLSKIPIIGNPAAYAANRLEVWDYVARYALQRPLHGYGIEATRAVTDFDSAQIYQAGTSILHPHNIALQLWMEFGVIGALAGAAFFAHLLWAIYRLPRAGQRIALPVLMGALSLGAMSYGLWQGWWLGLLILAAALTVVAARAAGQAEGRTVLGSSSQ